MMSPTGDNSELLAEIKAGKSLKPTPNSKGYTTGNHRNTSGNSIVDTRSTPRKSVEAPSTPRAAPLSQPHSLPPVAPPPVAPPPVAPPPPLPASTSCEKRHRAVNGSVDLGHVRSGSLVDVEALVPTHDEKGVPIPEWKRQVMVRKLQVKMQEEEDLKRKLAARGYSQSQDWHYSHTHNAILGPFGELMTEDDLIRIEHQIENLQVMHKVQAVEKELEQLERELTQLLPVSAALSHHQHFSVNPRQVHGQAEDLPEWCSKISTLLKNMAILLATLGGKEIDILDLVYSGYIQDERTDPRADPAPPTVPNSASLNIGRSQSFSTREDVEREIKQCGVSVKNLKANYELQSQPPAEDSAGRVYRRKMSLPVGSEPAGHRAEPILEEDYVFSSEDVHWSCGNGPLPSDATGATVNGGEAVTAPPYVPPVSALPENPDPPPQAQPEDPPGQPSQPTRSLEVQTDLSYMQEWTDLRKERIVFLFLEHWRKYTFASAVKPRFPGRQGSAGSEGSGAEGSLQSEDEQLIYLMKERQVVGNLICHWRTIFSQVPSRQIRRLSRAQIIYWPEHFLPHVNGTPVAYDSLTLDLFMLGYFQLLEMTMTRGERKFRHLLCFEMFDRLGTHSWELIRQFHREVMAELEAGRRDWADGFEDIKQRYFGDAVEEGAGGVSPQKLPATAPDPPVQPGPAPLPVQDGKESLCDPAPVPMQERKDSPCDPAPAPAPAPIPIPIQDSACDPPLAPAPAPAPVQDREDSPCDPAPLLVQERKESLCDPAPLLEQNTAVGLGEETTHIPLTRKDSIQVISELGEFSNEEICRYIDRSFSFWKEKEAELFDL
ncbi:hypothetical protein AAFF_G00394700 [Aldrovandia affinis]|uniref:WH2 domain-containing protein n=1 Tax=Aldrovandia affinis TaxID=143900 RepID=A0AAD7SFX3_9TELE|nr:hypothetical protein AAFF_G00394700 [Aldrovandia affinis]